MNVTTFVASDYNARTQETDPGNDTLDNTAGIGADDRVPIRATDCVDR
jgi:hypothetical protein